MAIPNNGDIVIAGGALSTAPDILVAGGASDTPARDYFITGGASYELPSTLGLESGSYAYTGNDSAVYRIFSLEAGSYEYSGEALVFERSYTYQSGVYQYTGNDATIARVLYADPGSYSVSGSDISYELYDYTLTAGAGEYQATGSGLAFSRTLRLNAEAAEYQVSGNDTNIARQLVISLASAAFTVTGTALTFKRNFTLAMAPATYAVTGNTLSFGLSRQIDLDAGSYATTGQPADILRVRRFTLEAGSYAVTMEEAQVRPTDPTLTADPGSYAITGNALNFTLTAAQLLGRYRPTRRRFQPPAYSFTTVKSHSGASYRRMWASKPSDAILEIEIDNMFDFDAEDLCRLYDSAQGTYGYIGLPEEFYDGASPELTAMIAQPFDDLKWAFSEPPSITGVKGEVCNVVMRFRARRSPTLRS